MYITVADEKHDMQMTLVTLWQAWLDAVALHTCTAEPHLMFWLARAVAIGVGEIRVALLAVGCWPCFAVMIKAVLAALPDDCRAARIRARD